MVAGLDRAMGDFVFEFEDTYLDFPVEVLRRMYDTAVGGFDIVAAVPSRRAAPDTDLLPLVQPVLLVRPAARLRAAAGVFPARDRRDAAAAGAGALPAGAVPTDRLPLRAAGVRRRTRSGRAAARTTCASPSTSSSR